MEETVHKCVFEPRSVELVVTKVIYTLAFTVFGAKFFKQKVEKSFLDNTEMEKRFNKLTKEVFDKKRNVEDAIPTKRWTRLDPQAP